MRCPLQRAALKATLGCLVLVAGSAVVAHERTPVNCSTGSNGEECGVRAALRTVPDEPRVGEPTALEFTLAEPSGAPLAQLATHHARKLHVVIVGEDMAVLGHVHPYDFREPVANGRGKVYFTFPRPGRYLVAIDALSEAGPHSAQFLVTVSGPGSRMASPAETLSPGLRVVPVQPHDRHVEPVVFKTGNRAAGYAVELESTARADAGVPLTLVYRFTRDGAPITDLRPFLAAPMHLAVVREGFSRFLHEHGTVAGEAGEGHHQHGSSHTHDHTHAVEPPAAFGPSVTATITFPEPGRYFLFGQAAAGDDLLVFRFPLLVE